MKLEQLKEKIDNWANSKRSDLFIQSYVNKINAEEDFCRRFALLTEDQKNNFIEKCINKYYSDKYEEKESKIGVQPRRCLFNYLLDYANKNCKLLDFKANDFAVLCFRLTQKYVIDLMIGQGSLVSVYEFEEKMLKNESRSNIS